MNNLKILDIGCGYNKYPNSIGIDKNYKTDVMLDLDKNDIPFNDESFDLVISKNSIEHFGNLQHIFSEVRRVLKKEGIFRIETTNIGVWWVRLALFMDINKGWRHKQGTKETGHLTHWTPDMLRMWFEINNFQTNTIKANHLLDFTIIIEGIKKTKLKTKRHKPNKILKRLIKMELYK